MPYFSGQSLIPGVVLIDPNDLETTNDYIAEIAPELMHKLDFFNGLFWSHAHHEEVALEAYRIGQEYKGE